jgi:ABC-type glycerol-3-phosphate transport system permease component
VAGSPDWGTRYYYYFDPDFICSCVFDAGSFDKNPLQYQWERYTISFPLRLGNYGAAWEFLDTYVWNTLLAAVIGFIGMIILSIIGGYVFARLRFPGREGLYYAIIMLMMVPWIISFVPQYVLYNDLGLTNSLWCVIVLNVASGPCLEFFCYVLSFLAFPRSSSSLPGSMARGIGR